MDRFEVIGTQIAAFINDPLQKAVRLIVPSQGTRFVVCGTSGSGKTRAIERANELLPPGEQIAESREILGAANVSQAIKTLEDNELAYEASLHIAFAVYNERLGKELEGAGVKVFWLDSGYRRTATA
jgi:ABC-type lipoprotein export system ATPase subunit